MSGTLDENKRPLVRLLGVPDRFRSTRETVTHPSMASLHETVKVFPELSRGAEFVRGVSKQVTVYL